MWRHILHNNSSVTLDIRGSLQATGSVACKPALCSTRSPLAAYAYKYCNQSFFVNQLCCYMMTK